MKITLLSGVFTSEAVRGKAQGRLRGAMAPVAGLLSSVIAVVLSLPPDTELLMLGCLHLSGLFHFLVAPTNTKRVHAAATEFTEQAVRHELHTRATLKIREDRHRARSDSRRD